MVGFAVHGSRFAVRGFFGVHGLRQMGADVDESVISLGARSQNPGVRRTKARCAQSTDDWLQIADYFEQSGRRSGRSVDSVLLVPGFRLLAP